MHINNPNILKLSGWWWKKWCVIESLIILLKDICIILIRIYVLYCIIMVKKIIIGIATCKIRLSLLIIKSFYIERLQDHNNFQI